MTHSYDSYCIPRTFKHSALIDLDISSFSDGEVGHCGYSGIIMGHFMRSFGVIKLEPTGILFRC